MELNVYDVIKSIISTPKSLDLRKKYGKRSFPLRKGDTVKIVRGEFRKKTGKIETVNVKKLRVMIEGIFRTKKDGTKVSVYFTPSNLLIKELNLDDVKRIKALERKGVVGEVKSDGKVEKKFKAKPLPKSEGKK